MRISAALALATWATFTCAAAVEYSGAKGLAKRWDDAEPHFPQPKHFQESRVRAHYDARFTKGPLEDVAQRDAIRHLIQTYLATFRDLGVQTWLMHGSLLGWWWGQKVMPWDPDADVQVTEADMYFLAAYYNMTIYYYKHNNMRRGKYYLLEVNPYFTHREQDDVLNVIDGRWIDMDTGLFIDITAARYALDHEMGEGVLYDKFGHEYRDTYVFPLLDTTFEGVPAKVPFKYRELLASEYGKKALKITNYRGYTFDETEMRWIADGEV